MKNTTLIFALALALGLATCGNQPNSNNAIDDGSIIDSVAVVSEAPFEWSFDLMWNIYMMKAFGYQLDEEDTVRLVRERAKRSYDAQPLKNTLHVHTIDLTYCYGDTDVVSFKYDEADKLFVFFLVDEDCEPPCHYSCQTFSYDLNEKTITEVECPIMPLEAKDFLDGLLLLDYTADQLSEMKPVEDCDEFRFMRGTENADLLVQAVWLDESLKHRANILAFDWNGHEFVRNPEADILGTTILKDGFCSLPFDSEIPYEIQGYDIERQTFMAEGEEQEKYVISKDGELIMEIEPEWEIASGGFMLDFDPDNLAMKPNHKVDIVNIYCDRYQTADKYHVGTLTREILEKYADEAITLYTVDEQLMVDVDGIQFVVDKNDYDGTLPEIQSDEGAIVENPTFRPEAKVKMIRLYNTK